MVDSGLARRSLTWLLAVVLLGAVVGTVYLAVGPVVLTEPYTEFYVTGPNGTAADLPSNVTADEPVTVVLGIANFEGEPQEYTVLVTVGDGPAESRTLRLAPEERIERPLSISFDTTGEQRVGLELYRGEPTGEPYRELSLTVTVRSARAVSNR